MEVCLELEALCFAQPVLRSNLITRVADAVRMDGSIAVYRVSVEWASNGVIGRAKLPLAAIVYRTQNNTLNLTEKRGCFWGWRNDFKFESP